MLLCDRQVMKGLTYALPPQMRPILTSSKRSPLLDIECSTHAGCTAANGALVSVTLPAQRLHGSFDDSAKGYPEMRARAGSRQPPSHVSDVGCLRGSAVEPRLQPHDNCISGRLLPRAAALPL